MIKTFLMLITGIKMEKEDVIRDVDEDELFCLFGSFLDRLKEKRRIYFSDMDNYTNNGRFVVMDNDIYKTVMEMKADWK